MHPLEESVEPRTFRFIGARRLGKAPGGRAGQAGDGKESACVRQEDLPSAEEAAVFAAIAARAGQGGVGGNESSSVEPLNPLGLDLAWRM